ncbi:glyoxalase family protein [Gracilibacillus halotolerans]|uniref:Glyoxalase family protein n=1 Tax=Gracilibacillus halotolerans TaxID=74386 RepID=A0A841RI22_9BACI|nr:glyoxalase family protein [Gracilibacillus halotolerans]
MLKTSGIHHITAIVNDPQITIDFYRDILGLKLVKKTVNFERPEVYHLYFSNPDGEPGSIITFFPWPKLIKGRVGTKQLGLTSYMIPKGSRTYWESRLQSKNISFQMVTRMDEDYLRFEDPAGLPIELVERDVSRLTISSTDGIEAKNAIQGIAGTVLYSTQPLKTAAVLENVLGMKLEKITTEYYRFTTTETIGNTIDVKLSHPVRGLAGAGTVHHIAWRVKDEKELQEWHALLIDKGYEPTEIKDRKYFQSLYFKEDGEIMFEMATDVPGFTEDERKQELGTKLMLPSWLEGRRKELEENLPPIY